MGRPSRRAAASRNNGNVVKQPTAKAPAPQPPPKQRSRLAAVLHEKKQWKTMIGMRITKVGKLNEKVQNLLVILETMKPKPKKKRSILLRQACHPPEHPQPTQPAHLIRPCAPCAACA